MSTFHFRRFDVKNERSAMKVNTDGVLLGAAMSLPTGSLPEGTRKLHALDIGTGTGAVALIIAQRLEGTDYEILGIDIDCISAEEAAENFAASPWSESLRSAPLSLQEFEACHIGCLPSGLPACRSTSNEPVDGPRKYDLVFSNPPYFDCSLEAPEQRRNEARHCNSLSYREILEFCGRNLSEGGTLSLILPSEVEKDLMRYARMCSLYPFRILRIRTVPRKAPRRIIAEFSRKRCNVPEESMLSIREEGDYTQEYVSLTQDFYKSLKV